MEEQGRLGHWHRSERRGEEFSESMAELIDKAKYLNDPQLKMVTRFVDFLIEVKKGNNVGERR